MKAGTNLEKVLESGNFAVTAEAGPPKGSSAEVIRRKGELLRYCCDGKLKYVDQEATYVCRDCKHKFPPPLYWCYHCLSQQEMDNIETTGELVCRRCGKMRYAH